ncbi:hypothetical protein JCM9533A_24920 [Catenuloplanes niger JCM 9533]|uniref:Uncharacterized protein n=1 Tax=Catenuloplanes niger TaxID=587534 RepID=A0AAE3ZVK0_9ACTN|nr:hypothetical protein [Catenuloplanes niger]
MKQAWRKSVRTSDAEMNLEEHYERKRVDSARDYCVATMRATLGRGRFPAALAIQTVEEATAAQKSLLSK